MEPWLSTGFLSGADQVSCLPHPDRVPCWLNFHTFQRVKQDRDTMTSDSPMATLKTRKSWGQRTPFKEIIPIQNSTCGQITKQVCGKHEDALKFTFKNIIQMSFSQKLLWINNTESGKSIHRLGRQEIQLGGRQRTTWEAVGSVWKTNDEKTWPIWSAWLCWEQSTDCEGNRRVSGSGNQQKKSSGDRWRASCCSAVRRSHTLQTRNQCIKEDVGSRK